MILLASALKFIFILISVLISVAFVTLFERKALSYMQIRKGPNKWGIKGVLQPFNDAIKLLTKEVLSLSFSNSILYYTSPVLILGISLISWLSFPLLLGGLELSLTIVFILCCLSSSVYPILGAGWSSNSKYSSLGSLRAVAQTISYEVSFALIVLSLVLINSSYMLKNFFLYPQWNILTITPLLIVWFISILAETNRTPFDFSEGESELVSGFNTEFSAGGFVLFFLAEYSSILFMSLLTLVFFLPIKFFTLLVGAQISLVVFMFLWVRGTLPRLRYDKLMMLAWKSFLPVSLSYLIFLMGIFLVF